MNNATCVIIIFKGYAIKLRHQLPDEIMKESEIIMNKKLIKVSLLLGVILLLTGCVSAEEKAQAEAWRKQAEKNATTYIQEKYGFEPEILESKTQKASDLFASRPTSQTLITMEYKGKEFSALVQGDDDYMDRATDNYQKEEIIEAYSEAVTALFDVTPDQLEVLGGDNAYDAFINGDEFYDMFFHEYFDGNNLEEVIMQDQFFCVTEYIGDVDFSSLFDENKTSLFEHKNMYGIFVCYDNKQDMKEAEIVPSDDNHGNLYENAMFVKSAFEIDGPNATLQTIDVGQCEDFYYLSVNTDTSQYDIVAASEQYDASDWNGHGFKDARAVSDVAYYLDGNVSDKLYLYYPKEKYEQLCKDNGGNHIVIASHSLSEKSGKDSYSIWNMEDSMEDYTIFWTHNADAEQYSFRFLYNTKE